MIPRTYETVEFPDPPADRPLVFLNMVATLDGKIITGNRNEPVMDLGSKVDHAALRDLESHAQAVMVGAETVRATPKIWFSNHLVKLTVTRSGDLSFQSRFFTDAPEQAVIVCPQGTSIDTPKGVEVWHQGPNGEMLPILQRLRAERGVLRMVLEGGSELNAVMLRENIVDEFFLTLAPKMKLGSETPTIAGGSPLDRSELLLWDLVGCSQVENELFLRYRRRR